MWQVALGWHAMEFAQTSAILEFYFRYWFRFWPYHRSRHVILHQSAKFLSKSDRPRQKKMTSCRFSRRRISVILDFRGPIMGSLKTPCTTSYRSSLDIIGVVFEKIVFFFCILATDRRTDGQLRCKRRTAFFEPNELNQTHSKPNGVFFSKTRTEMKFKKKIHSAHP